MGAIIGGAAGGIIVLGIVIGVGIYLATKKKRPSAPTTVTITSTPTATHNVGGIDLEEMGTVSAARPSSMETPRKSDNDATMQSIEFSANGPLGITLKQMENGTVEMSGVEPSSAAAAVPIGSTVEAINGTSCAGKSKDEVMVMIIDAKSAGPVTVTFECKALASPRRSVSDHI